MLALAMMLAVCDARRGRGPGFVQNAAESKRLHALLAEIAEVSGSYELCGIGFRTGRHVLHTSQPTGRHPGCVSRTPTLLLLLLLLLFFCCFLPSEDPHEMHAPIHHPPTTATNLSGKHKLAAP